MEAPAPHRTHWWAFFRQWLRNPLRTAAVAPSSRDLAAAMIDELPPDAARIIELGGGTGALTRALLAHGIRGDALLVVELNEELHAHLHARFPQVRISLGDATELLELAELCGFLSKGRADAIVSGLGLLAMHVEMQQSILEQAFVCLRQGGRFIQFTYGPQAPVAPSVVDALGLTVRKGDFVLRNVPPATVYVYERPGPSTDRPQPCVPPAALASTRADPQPSGLSNEEVPMSTTTATTYARVARKLRGRPASDGAGVKLTRVIGSPELDMLDPFLLLDEFGTDRAEDYLAGFPDHPHRGFETVTYMLDGRMRHRDNHGNEGLLVPGSVQWMTAGRGLVHSEMPEQQEGRMRGFQLWVNLPKANKMDAPQYQEFAPEKLPHAQPAEGVDVKVIAGEVDGVRGPIEQPATSPVYFDISLDPGAAWEYALPEGHSAFAYVFEGDATIGAGEDARAVASQELAVLGGGEVFAVRAGAKGTRVILVAGRPLREPVARYGPFVMNTKEEIMQAFVDFQEGKF